MARYPIVKIHKSFVFFLFFWGGWGGPLFSKFRIQSGMILVNTVPNPKTVAPKLQKLYRKVSINVARHQRQRLRHQPGKTSSLVEIKFRREKNESGDNESQPMTA